MPVTHCHPMMSPSHVAKQQLLYSALLTSHRRYSDEKQDDTTRGDCINAIKSMVYNDNRNKYTTETNTIMLLVV